MINHTSGTPSNRQFIRPPDPAQRTAGPGPSQLAAGPTSRLRDDDQGSLVVCRRFWHNAPSAYPQNLFGHLSWACGSLSLGRGRGVRGFAAWRTPLKPLTLTLSQRERGYERMAKKVSCFCTRASMPQAPGPVQAGCAVDSAWGRLGFCGSVA